MQQSDDTADEDHELQALFDDAVAGDTRDPYPELAVARRDTPIQRIDVSAMPHEGDSPVFFVYRYEDIVQVLRDPTTFSSRHIVDLIMGPVMGEHIMLGMDDPEHRRYRALVSQAFRHRSLAEREGELIVAAADRLIDRFAGRGRADLVPAFTFPFPTQVIAGLLGLPPEDDRRFQSWSRRILGFYRDLDDAQRAAGDVRAYVATILDDRRRRPRPDLISSLAHAEIDGERLSDDEIYSFVLLLLPAGVETTFRATGNLLLSLLQRPAQLAAVRADRDLLPAAVEEALRFETPLLNITRLATADAEVGGAAIPRGSTVMLVLAAANRQPDRWEDPDRFAIDRVDPRPHLSFGTGPHMCLGMHLARIEMRVALDRLLDRLPGLRLDPEAADPHIRGQVFRSPTAIPVVFDA